MPLVGPYAWKLYYFTMRMIHAQCLYCTGADNSKSFSRLVCMKAGFRKATAGALATVASSKILFRLPFKVHCDFSCCAKTMTTAPPLLVIVLCCI